jgi:SAM-dependent methyltransferase
VTERTGPPPPRRADVADSYNRGADTYEALWSPVILPPAAALVAFLRLTGRPVVADVGGGTGALLGAIGSAAPAARVVTLDASAAMLQAARVRRGASAILADALALPFAAGTVDAVILAYVLFHLADPPLALAEAARVLRPGGRAGIITWAWERESRAHTLWDQILAGTGVPPAPPRRADAGLDRPDTVEALLRSAGLRPERIWCERLRRQWDHSSFWELATGGGANRVRLSLISAPARAAVLDRAQTALSRLMAQDFLWEGEVICAVATKNRSGHPGGNGGTAKTVEELLAEARAVLPHRPSPAEAFEAQANGALTGSSLAPWWCPAMCSSGDAIRFPHGGTLPSNRRIRRSCCSATKGFSRAWPRPPCSSLGCEMPPTLTAALPPGRRRTCRWCPTETAQS